jgi:hypothetical protein
VRSEDGVVEIATLELPECQKQASAASQDRSLPKIQRDAERELAQRELVRDALGGGKIC